MSERSALVTGGAGFIGRRIVDQLCRMGWRVTVVDDLSSPGSVPPACADRVMVRSVHSALPKLAGPFDLVFHLAATVGVRRVLANPRAMLRHHYADAVIVARLAKQWGSRVVFASSSEVYGMGTGSYMRENDALLLPPPFEPRWAYAASKLHAEHLFLAEHRQFGLSVTIVRYFNVAGAGQHYGGGFVLPTWAHEAVEGRPLVIHGDGDQTRSFCHVRDAADATCALAFIPEAKGQIVNVGCRTGTTIDAAARLMQRVLEEKLGRSVKIEYLSWNDVGAGYAAIRTRVPSTARLRQLIGFEPPECLGDIVEEVAAEWVAPIAHMAEAQ